MARTTQTEMVYEKLRDKIAKGFYSPGENLPEVELSSEYGVSRNTLKKALLMLEADALVTIEPNKGAKVRSYSKKEVLDYLNLRIELEGFITRQAVPAFTKSDQSKLEKLYLELDARYQAHDLLGYSACNLKFHQVIYDACPNRLATEILSKLKAQMRKYNGKTILVPGRADQSYAEHNAIYHAIVAGDAEAAAIATRKHVESVRDIFDEYYSLLF